jgi:peptidoglycan/xylan/chitin deacetylase (PgdA/CDA1 family)
MDFLAERGYRVVAMRRLEELLGSGRVPDEKTVVVTLDDGYRDAYTEAFPVLRTRGFGATIFVITDLIDNPRYLSVAQLRELSASGFEIGSHSASHSDLPSLNPQRLRREVVDSRSTLERILGGPVTSFCYPSGQHPGRARGGQGGRLQVGGHGRSGPLSRARGPLRAPPGARLRRHGDRLARARDRGAGPRPDDLAALPQRRTPAPAAVVAVLGS